jgi:para-nitrobenzyl esterase
MKLTKTVRMFFLAILIVALSPVLDTRTDRGGFLKALAFAASSWENTATVVTTRGMVKGFADSFKTWSWKAIPYARPPVGDLRWKAPQAPDSWSETREEIEFCSRCPQFSTTETGIIIAGSEDCLCLNIWRPQSAETNLPVYFWIHGGSNVQGSADPYIGATMASRSNMVIVTINYRLGPLGWFTHPALRDGENAFNSSGNYATMDMIKALEWVRDNIAAFGGNPQNVTIAGQSAGGINVLTLMISPVAKDLFHRVISQSGGLEPASQKDGDDYANTVIEALLVRDGTPEKSARSEREAMSNAEIRTYLRSKTMEEFFTAISGMKRNPAVFNDGAVIDQDGANAFDDPAKYHQVPVIIGSTSEEGKLFMYLAGVHKFMGNGLYQWIGKRLSQIGRQNGLDTIAQKMSSHETQPGVYSYIFQYGQYNRNGYNAWPTDSGPTDKMSWAIALGSFHALDIPFNFGLIGSFPLFADATDYLFREDNRPGQMALSDAMMTYTAQFARTGNPNSAGLPDWTKWPAGKRSREPKFMLFDANDTDAILKMAPDVQ